MQRGLLSLPKLNICSEALCEVIQVRVTGLSYVIHVLPLDAQELKQEAENQHFLHDLI